jgi:hypothetical protein
MYYLIFKIGIFPVLHPVQQYLMFTAYTSMSDTANTTVVLIACTALFDAAHTTVPDTDTAVSDTYILIQNQVAVLHLKETTA